MDAATVQCLPDVPVHEIGHIEVRGFSAPTEVFAPDGETVVQLRLRSVRPV